MENPIELRANPLHDGEISLNFNREGFSDFLGTLLQTPREEQKSLSLGFDITPGDMRVLYEKLNQHIATQNDVLNVELSAQIAFGDESDLTVGSIEEFSDVDYGSRPDPEKFTVSITYLIGFTRTGGKKVYERQVVQLIASKGIPGLFEIRVRSTEITWSPAIMTLMEKEVRSLSGRTSPQLKDKVNRFFFCSEFFRTTDAVDSKRLRKILEREKALMTVAFAMFPFMFLAMVLDKIKSQDVFIYDPETKTVSLTEFSTLVDTVGWERAAELSIFSKQMAESGYATYMDGEGPIARFFSHIAGVFDLYSIFIALLFGGFIIANVRFAAFMDRAQQGRLFLSEKDIVPRASIPVWTGWLGGIIAALTANVLTQLIFNSL